MYPHVRCIVRAAKLSQNHDMLPMLKKHPGIVGEILLVGVTSARRSAPMVYIEMSLCVH